MKTPSSSALIGIALLVAAGFFLVFDLDRPASGTDESQSSMGQRSSDPHHRVPSPAVSGGMAAPSDEPPLILTDEGLAEFTNYDRDGDGDPEIGAFLDVYRRVDTIAAKIDMLENVRTFDTTDEPRLNDLLINQAAKAEDSEIRNAARSALFEHGGEKAHESLEAYLKSETRAADRHELEKLLANLKRTPLNLVKSGSRNQPSITSPPSTNN